MAIMIVNNVHNTKSNEYFICCSNHGCKL